MRKEWVQADENVVKKDDLSVGFKYLFFSMISTRNNNNDGITTSLKGKRSGRFELLTSGFNSLIGFAGKQPHYTANSL